MKIGFIFAGQGSQYVGMGKDFYDQYEVARDVYQSADIDFDVASLCFEGPSDLLNETSYAQPCLLTTSLAISKVLESYGIVPDYVAGLSLGEYSALSYAKAMSIKDAIQIVRKRGQLMSNALPAGKTSMAAVLAMDPQDIQRVIQDIDGVTIANYNCPGQIVITGMKEAVEKAGEKLKEAGAKRVIPLKVSGAFHSPLLEEASYQLKEELEKYTIQKPEIPVVYNISGKEEDGDIVDILTRQIKSSVYFYQSLEYMIDKGIDMFVEIGPGKALSAFVKKTNRQIPVYSIDNVENLKQLLEVLKNE